MNFLDIDFPGVTEAYKGSLEDWLELFERYAFPRTGDTETSTEMKRIFKRYTEVTYEDWLDIIIKCARDEIWYEEKINLSIRELYLVVNKVARISEKLKAIYAKFSISNNLLEQQYLQEAVSYIGILRKAYTNNKDLVTPTIDELRRQYCVTHQFLASQNFDPYFGYLTDIFKLNKYSRYRPIEELAAERENPKQMLEQALDAHHIIFRSLGGEEKNTNNLIALFREEHIKAHELFVDCLKSYLVAPEANAEDEFNIILAKAQRGLTRLSGDNQDRVSVDVLIDLLADDLETDQEELIARINVKNVMNHLPVYGRQQTNKDDSNLQAKEKDKYIVTFIKNITDIPNLNEIKIDPNDPRIDPNDPRRAIVYGVDGVMKIIFDATGERISKDSVKNRITSEGKDYPINKKGTQVLPASFKAFYLQYPHGIYRATGGGTLHKSKPIIYFKVDNNTRTVDYSSGQWIQNPNALKTRNIGCPHDAYNRLDQTHNDLVAGIDLSRVFMGNIDDTLDSKTQQRDFFVFMYADDIDLLQNIINEKNKNNRTRQISIKVMKDGKIWYPESEQDLLVASLKPKNF